MSGPASEHMPTGHSFETAVRDPSLFGVSGSALRKTASVELRPYAITCIMTG